MVAAALVVGMHLEERLSLQFEQRSRGLGAPNLPPYVYIIYISAVVIMNLKINSGFLLIPKNKKTAENQGAK